MQPPRAKPSARSSPMPYTGQTTATIRPRPALYIDAYIMYHYKGHHISINSLSIGTRKAKHRVEEKRRAAWDSLAVGS